MKDLNHLHIGRLTCLEQVMPGGTLLSITALPPKLKSHRLATVFRL